MPWLHRLPVDDGASLPSRPLSTDERRPVGPDPVAENPDPVPFSSYGGSRARRVRGSLSRLRAAALCREEAAGVALSSTATMRLVCSARWCVARRPPGASASSPRGRRRRGCAGTALRRGPDPGAAATVDIGGPPHAEPVRTGPLVQVGAAAVQTRGPSTPATQHRPELSGIAAAAAATCASSGRRGSSHGPAPRGEATSATRVRCPLVLAIAVLRGLVPVKVAVDRQPA